MSDFLADSPIVFQVECPTCKPDLDPRMYDLRYCEPHTPSWEGECDRLVQQLAYLSGSGEAGGADNKAFCDFFHRGK